MPDMKSQIECLGNRLKHERSLKIYWMGSMEAAAMASEAWSRQKGSRHRFTENTGENQP